MQTVTGVRTTVLVINVKMVPRASTKLTHIRVNVFLDIKVGVITYYTATLNIICNCSYILNDLII